MSVRNGVTRVTTAEAIRQKLAPDMDRHDEAVAEHMRDPNWVKELKASIRQVGSGKIRRWRDLYSGTK